MEPPPLPDDADPDEEPVETRAMTSAEVARIMDHAVDEDLDPGGAVALVQWLLDESIVLLPAAVGLSPQAEARLGLARLKLRP